MLLNPQFEIELTCRSVSVGSEPAQMNCFFRESNNKNIFTEMDSDVSEVCECMCAGFPYFLKYPLINTVNTF